MSELAPGSADAQPGYSGIHGDIVSLLEAARHAAARSVNALMTASYWEIGRRIVEFEQGGRERAVYGEDLIKRLGGDLTRRFGRGFGWRNLAQMRSFLPGLACRPDFADAVCKIWSANSPGGVRRIA